MKIQSAAIALIPLVAAVALSTAVSSQTLPPSVWDGVYTEAQSNRGKELYAKMCAGCHGRNVEGTQNYPGLTGEEFVATWDGLTMGHLYDRIHQAMPPRAPGSLKPEQVSDIMAFVLASNRFPAGATELPTDTSALRQIRYASRKTEVFAETGILNLVDHVHIFVANRLKARDFYQRHLGGRPVPPSGNAYNDARQRMWLMFGETRMVIARNLKPQPTTGSTIDRLGFSVPNVDATVKALEADGAKVVTPARDLPGLYRMAVLDDPFGIRLEIVQDAAQLGLHHIQLRSEDPAATLAWYADKFGGKVEKLKNQLEGINYGGVWLLVERGQGTSTDGHVIEHFGFRPLSVAKWMAAMSTKNVKTTHAPDTAGTVRFAFVEAPDKLPVELTQR